MKVKKINTIPNGRIIIFTIAFEILLTFLLGVMLLPSITAVGLFAFSLVFSMIMIYYLKHKYWNFIEMSKKIVCHNNQSYDWDDVYITVTYSKPNIARNSFDYYVYFDDHYLSEEEIESKSIKSKGFYMMLTEKRTELLLGFEPKKIKILKESPYSRNKIILQKIASYLQNSN